MSEMRFDAETFVSSETIDETQRMAFTFSDAAGNTQVLSLPTIAAIALIPWLQEAERKARYPKGQRPTLVNAPRKIAVSIAADEPIVLLHIDEHAPLALGIEEARKTGVALASYADRVAHRKPQPRN